MGLFFIIETHSLPNAHSLLPSQLYLDHSLRPLLAPATLAALPSTRAIPDRDVFYVAPPVRSIPASYSFVPLKTGKIQKYVLRAQRTTIAPQ
jgi:hypothetical protein